VLTLGTRQMAPQSQTRLGKT